KHGRRQKPKLSATSSRPPANINVVAGLPELRIESIDGLEPALAESHVAAWDMLCFAIRKKHMSRPARRARDTTRGLSVVRDWNVRPADASVIFLEECSGEICQPMRIGAGVVINVSDDLSGCRLPSQVSGRAQTLVFCADQADVVLGRDITNAIG